MKRFLLIAACIAMLFPAFSADGPVRAESGADGLAPSSAEPLPLGFNTTFDDRMQVLERARRLQVQNQVRVEQRVVVRVAPSSNATRTRLMAELPRRQMRTRYQQVEHGECVAIEQVAGVQPMEDNRLLLIMRNRQLLTASLQRSCSARDFYSGFYVERNEDGQLCIARDQLQSRAGSSCQVADFHRLVAVRN